MLPWRFTLLLLVPFVLIGVGTVGLHLIEGMPLFDALYLTVITLTTIGFGDVVPVTTSGKVFVMFLALGGIFTLFFAAAEVLRAVVGGELRLLLGRQIMERTLAELHDHMIVCGYGRMGRLVCHEFSRMGLAFVVVEHDAELLEGFTLTGGIPLHGDSTSDEVLRKAGVERARALVAVMRSDADNLYATMSARLLNARLFIVARAEDERAEPKFRRAGANRVVSPYVIGGQRVAQAVLRPTVMDFIELATRTEHLELQIEETRIAARSKLAGVRLVDSQLRQALGLIIVVIKKPDGKMLFNPPPESVMEAGDVLITLGHRQQLDQLEKLAAG